jgi:hypothetical protein
MSSNKLSEISAMSLENPADRPVPPPGLVPTPAVSPPTPSATTALLPLGYTKTHGFNISPHLVAWLPAILLTLTFICTFFPWVGMYRGGAAVYSQGPWRALFGYPTRNIELESLMLTPSGWLDKVKSNWELMIPYLLSLFAAVALAWADRGIRVFDPRKIPPLVKIWPWRHAVIAVLAGFAFALMSIQVSWGFGLERAIRRVVSEDFAKAREAAADSPSELFKLKYSEDQEFKKFNLEHTSWLCLGLTSNFLAVLAMLAHIGLDKRGSKPPPRIVIQY